MSQSLPNSMLIAIQETEGRLDRTLPIPERFKQAAKLMREHWMIIEEEQQFRCAVGAIMLTVTKEEQDIIIDEMKNLQLLTIMLDHPGEFDVTAFLEVNGREKWFHLLKLWRETKT